MNDQPKVRWGILGAGIIARKFADALRLDPDSELVLVASRTPEKAANFASEYQVKPASYESLVTSPNIDIIYIATTHNFHHDNAMLALSYGKNLVVEKPFTVNAKQAKNIVDLSREKGCFLMEAIWTRFMPNVIRLKEMLNQGEIGQLKHLNLTFGKFIPDQHRTRLSSPDLAGGVTLDMGIYPISFICYMLGEFPCEIKSTALFSDTGVDELVSYQFRFSSQCTASVSASYDLFMPSKAMIYGTRGYIDYSDFNHGGDFSIATHDGNNEVYTQKTVSTPSNDNGFTYQIAEAVHCLRAEKLESAIIPLDESIAIMAIMDQMREEWGFKYPFE